MPAELRESKKPGAGSPGTSPRLSELHQFFRRFARYDEEFLIHDDGFRGRTFRYGEVARLAESFAVRLAAQGIRKGDTVMIWSESRPGWIVAL